MLLIPYALVRTGWFVRDARASTEDSIPRDLNSQTLPLPRAPQNPGGFLLARGGGDITTVGNALLAQSGPSGTIADIETNEVKNGQISVYVVREGDTLSQIAEMFSVSTNTIRWANDINKDTAIQPGDTLIILPVSGVKHTVAKGDTLQSIAKKYGGDLEEILNYNGLSAGTELAVGDVVVIPDGEIAAPKPSASPSSSRARITGGGGPTYAGYYMRPITGGTRSQGLHGYNGIDLATYAGAEIYASAAGDVIISKNGGWNGGYGSYVVVRHDNGTQTLYAHNSNNIVGVGQRVVQGQVIGYVGATGRATGAHVHFEVRGAANPF
ncbi:M23 family metallopeptidase [Candidatus Wolfebacteria bacterium]|nr:M23 family metallopeptidase [Candidatus Wolfebacteria bacterium]